MSVRLHRYPPRSPWLSNRMGTFAGGIVITTVATAANSWTSGVALQSDGKIVTVGTVGSTGKKGFTPGGGYVLRYLGQ